ncbi:BPL-N domain-containing protein [Pantoea sp. BS_8]|uniref:BPL-N domain-containing protein n=1 Tax=Pantoea sp. BS_8 TaxID=3055781 RepID=UPI0035C1049E
MRLAYHAILRPRNGRLTALLLALSLVPGAVLAVPPPLNIAVYRGAAGCDGCSEMVVKSLHGLTRPVRTTYIGEHETLRLTAQNLRQFDLYIQPGGGQDIPAAYAALGEEGVRAIRQFVRSGKGFLGLCMGAYLADSQWLGLISSPLESEVGRPGSGIADEGDYTIRVDWQRQPTRFYYQDGPYLEGNQARDGFTPLAFYRNGDVAIAHYTYGKGTVVLTGPHPEADESWMGQADGGKDGVDTTPQEKMSRLLAGFDNTRRVP